MLLRKPLPLAVKESESFLFRRWTMKANMPDYSNLSVLIVDPSQSMRSSVHNMLTQVRITKVDHASNSATAIRHLGLKSFDVILCEYDLDGGAENGGQDGQQLLAVLAAVFGAAVQVILAQDHVERLQAQMADRGGGVGRMVDLGDAHLGQHIVDARAHALAGIDDQHRQIAIVWHVCFHGPPTEKEGFFFLNGERRRFPE